MHAAPHNRVRSVVGAKYPIIYASLSSFIGQFIAYSLWNSASINILTITGKYHVKLSVRRFDMANWPCCSWSQSSAGSCKEKSVLIIRCLFRSMQCFTFFLFRYFSRLLLARSSDIRRSHIPDQTWKKKNSCGCCTIYLSTWNFSTFRKEMHVNLLNYCAK